MLLTLSTFTRGGNKNFSGGGDFQRGRIETGYGKMKPEVEKRSIQKG